MFNFFISGFLLGKAKCSKSKSAMFSDVSFITENGFGLNGNLASTVSFKQLSDIYEVLLKSPDEH